MRTVSIAGGVFLVLATLACVDRSRSETKPTAPPTRVAIFNLSYVAKHSEKHAAFQEELKGEFKQFENRLNELKAKVEQLGKTLTKPDISDDKREEIQSELKNVQREMEKCSDEAKRALTKKSDKHMVIVYSDLREAVERYAKAHSIDLVMHYTDATEERDFNDPQVIGRKVQSTGCVPIYSAAGIDITKELVSAMKNK